MKAAEETLLLPNSPLEMPFDDAARWARLKLYARVALTALWVSCAVLFGLMWWQMAVRSAEKSSWAIATSFAAVCVAVPISMYDLNAHLQNWVSPLQRHYIRILGLVPIYSLESWLALTFRQQRIYLEVARESYEAFVVYSFFRLMMESMGDRERVVKVCAAKGGAARWLPPSSWVLPSSWRWPMGEVFVWRCERGVFQYVFLRVACAIVALAAELGGVLCEGWTEPQSCAAPYLNFTIVVSQFVAMYCLVLFWHELQAELEPVNALRKLLAVKAVVFLSFFQGLVLAGLIYLKVVTATNSFSVTDLVGGARPRPRPRPHTRARAPRPLHTHTSCRPHPAPSRSRRASKTFSFAGKWRWRR